MIVQYYTIKRHTYTLNQLVNRLKVGEMKLKHTATKTTHYRVKQNKENRLGPHRNRLKNPVDTSVTIIPLPIDILNIYIYTQISSALH